MLISVVIPAFDEERYLGRTLDSPNFILLFPRRESAWRGWCKEVPRWNSGIRASNFHTSYAPPGSDKAIDSRGGRVLW